MKKLVCLLLCFVMTMTIFVACSNKEEKEEKKESKEVTMDVAATADALLDKIEFVDEMTVIDSVDFFTAWFSIEAADVKEQKTYKGTGATAEVVAAVKCTDEDAAKRVEEAFKTYAKTNSEAYADYKPEECEKLDNPVIKVYSEYVVLCISDDNDTAKTTIESQVK